MVTVYGSLTPGKSSRARSALEQPQIPQRRRETGILDGAARKPAVPAIDADGRVPEPGRWPPGPSAVLGDAAGDGGIDPQPVAAIDARLKRVRARPRFAAMPCIQR